MSLTSFHIIFVLCAISVSVFVGGWGVREYSRSGDLTSLIVGVSCALLGLVLVGYSFWFLRKIKELKL